MCNLCEFNKIVNDAIKEGLTVSSLSAEYELGGIDVFVHPIGINAYENRNDSEFRDKYFKAWFMSIPMEHVN